MNKEKILILQTAIDRIKKLKCPVEIKGFSSDIFIQLRETALREAVLVLYEMIAEETKK